MKAVFIDRFGGPEVLTYGDQPDPVAGPGQVVVDVAAASVNGADWRVRAGQYAEAKFPLILGRDFSGTVSAAAADVHDLKVGDAVFGVLEAGREGAYAEKLAIAAAIIAKKPDALSHVHAAAMALTGLTAVISIETTLKLQRGETILIQGGAGGVASFAIQLAKHIGARVITTSSTANLDYVRGLGADEVIDYKRAGFYPGGQRLRCGLRYGRRRCGAEIVCRVAARRPRRLYRLRADGAKAGALGRDVLASGGRPLPCTARAHRPTGRRRRRSAAGNQAIPAVAGRRSASHQRRPSLPRQARLSGALRRCA